MLIYIFLLLIILSLEATIGLPIFFLYLSYNFISRRGQKFLLSALFVMAFVLSIFYSLSWPMMAFLLLFFHLFYQKLVGKIFWQFLLFCLLNLIIAKMANLQFNFFYLFHLPAFLFYFYKVNFKNYAA